MGVGRDGDDAGDPEVERRDVVPELLAEGQDEAPEAAVDVQWDPALEGEPTEVRDRVDVPADISESDLRELVLAREKVLAATADGIRTVIVRPPSLVNVVPM